MTKFQQFKYKRAFFWYMGILMIFLITADFLIVSGQRRQLLTETEKKRHDELELISTFIQESLLKHHYAETEDFLMRWGKNHDDIIEIKAVTPDDFVLAHYKSDRLVLHPFLQKKLVSYAGSDLIILSVTSDFSSQEKILHRLHLQLIGTSIILITILGTSLWFIIKKMAVKPLETEIVARKHSEELLQRSRDDLEKRVHERTKDLYEINQDLEQEIAEKSKAEEEILKEKQKFENIVEGIGAALLVLDKEARIIWGNEIVQQWFGPIENMKGKYCYELFNFANPHKECASLSALSTGKTEHAESIVTSIDGVKLHIYSTASPVKDRNGKIVQFVELMEDITVRSKAEEALRLSEDKFSKAFRSSPTLMAISTLKEGRFLEVNDAFLMASGFSRDEVIGHTAMDLRIWADPADRDRVIELLREHSIVCNFETRMRAKDGNILRVLWSAELVDIDSKPCILSVTLDITEMKRLESQLFQAQKMEAVGQLAGGVAHDFNNILTAIISNCYFLRKKLGEHKPETEIIDRVITISNNAAKITRELLVFSRKQYIEPVPISLNDSILHIKNFLKNFISADIEIKTFLSTENLTILSDRNQLDQVLINLATNARDAMPNGGILTIESRLVEMDENFIRVHGFGKAGKYALLAITDTGTGMDRKTQEKIFEPFFSTKDVDKGTGLGLSIVYGIVQQYNGYLDVYSEPGMGTSIRVYFPEIKAEIKKEKEEMLTKINLKGNGETILFAEDESSVRDSISRILEEFNYRVIEASDGKDAVEKYMTFKDKIDILVLDVIMPKKSGEIVLKEIKQIQPDIKAIFISGYTGNKISSHKNGVNGAVLISKPLSPEDLLSKIKIMLGSTD